jgi:hypothetical protein
MTVKNVTDKTIWDVARIEFCVLDGAGGILDTSVCFVRNAWEMNFEPGQELTVVGSGVDFPEGRVNVIVTGYGYNSIKRGYKG